eukprot:g19915.t1
MMAGKPQAKFEWIPVVPLNAAPEPGTAKSVFVADLDLCVAADEKGLLYVLGNKCPPANQPLSFSLVVNGVIKDPVLGTKIDIETGDVVEWCPSLLGKLLSPLLGPEPENAGVNVFKVRSKGSNLEAYLNVNARQEFESSYWTGILDAQGKADGCRVGSKAATRWLRTAAAALGSAATLEACFAQTVIGDDEQGWQLVVPSTTALPSIEPPASFNRSVNNIRPMGTSEELSGALPNRLQTNKFYSNFLIDGPSKGAWTLPYLVTVNEEYPFGMYVSHPTYFPGQFASDGRLKWYATSSNKDLIISAQELNANQLAVISDFDSEGLSAAIKFTSEEVTEVGEGLPRDEGPAGSMTTYVVRGMAYATVMYENFSPEISSIHAMLRVNGRTIKEGNGNHTSPDGRFELELNDGSMWILYSSDPELEFHYITAQPNEPNKLQSNTTINGTLRATLVPYNKEDASHDAVVALLDKHAGSYPIDGEVSGWMNETDDHRGRYSITWKTGGNGSVDLLHYALPHHQGLLPEDVKTGFFMSSATKGNMQMVTGSEWILHEDNLPDFEWVPSASSITSETEMEWIEHHLELEIEKPLYIDAVAGWSVYFGAKNLMAYAQLCLVAEEIGRDDLLGQCVDKVEVGFDAYLRSTNGNPLTYDTVWGGVIGALGLEEGNESADFYASFYNDHHFHYSYLLHAAATLAHLRPAWATADNKNWVDTLIRDVNDPNKEDEYFPQFRSFDWFCGHSWARGLLFSYDGKDQESTSEDVNFFYAMTMWAIATGNSRLEGLGRLQTGMVTRSIDSYFLLKDSNTNHPVDFVRNKVTGIFFESKIDYTTWFGDNVEYIHGIQNIPVTAVTASVRTPEFVREEWDQRLFEVATLADGVWATVLYMSYATIQKHAAFGEMLTTGVDDGLRRSWALYWAATRPDCALFCNHDEVEIEEAPVPTPAPTEASGPYLGTPALVPGTIEAEAFDYGGEGVGYHDTSAGNSGGALRLTEDVDIKSDEAGGYYVGWTSASEYLSYMVEVTEDVEAFDFEFLVAAPSDLKGQFQVVSGGTGCGDYTTDLSGVFEVQSTGDWMAFEVESTYHEGSGGLSAGFHTILLCVIAPGFNINSFTMTPHVTKGPTTAPTVAALQGGAYLGSAAAIPGTIEAEEYDEGGQGIAYYDTNTANNGGSFRTSEGVDTKASESGGHYVGWIRAGEFIRYAVDVTTAVDSFDFEFVVASPAGFAGSFQVVGGGTGCSDYEIDLSGVIEITPTGNWNKFETQSSSGGGQGGLPEGPNTIWLCMISSGFNLDSFTMTPSP